MTSTRPITDEDLVAALRPAGPLRLPDDVLAAARAEAARADTPTRHRLAPAGFRPALAFAALLALLLAAALAAMFVGSQNEIPPPAPLPTLTPSSSPATSAGGDGLILFGIDVPVSHSTPCTTFHTIRPDGSDERDLSGGCWSSSH